MLGLRTPKQILVKLKEVDKGTSKRILFKFQHQFSLPGSNKRVDDVVVHLSQLQARIRELSIVDRPTELLKKNAFLRCYQENYLTTIQTLRIVASDYILAQVVGKLKKAEFNSTVISTETTPCA